MAQSVLEMATDLVSAQIKTGDISPENTSALLDTIHHQLLLLKLKEESGTQAGADQTVRQFTSWRKSIAKYTVTCMECGASFKQLDPRHLRQHNLDKRSYRKKYGIPSTQSLVARELTARRRAIAQQVRPWEKAPAYISAQESIVTNKKKTAKTTKAAAKRKTSAG